MRAQRIVYVRFLQPYPPYHVGETIGIIERLAVGVVRPGIAEFVNQRDASRLSVDRMARRYVTKGA